LIKSNQKPFNARLAYTLLGISLIIIILYVGQHLIFPLLLALLLSILLRPIVSFLCNKWRFPHVIAAAVAVLLCILFLSGIVFFISWQVGDIANDWVKIKSNVDIHFHNIQVWIKLKFNLSLKEQNIYIKEATERSINKNSSMMGNTLNSFTDALVSMVIIPIYTFLFLIYRVLLINFLSKLFKAEHQHTLFDILLNVKIAIRSFLVGLLTEMLIVASLTSLGYFIIGAQYALLLGVITGILNLIPYVGITLAGLLSIIATLTGSTDLSMVLGVLIVNIVVQFLDNNFLVPLVVSSKVKVNALVSLVGILAGGAIAGVAGMFLAIPIIAILKVIFDRIDFLEPWGYLMGDNLPKTSNWGKIKLPSFNAGDEIVHKTSLDQSKKDENGEKENNIPNKS